MYILYICYGVYKCVDANVCLIPTVIILSSTVESSSSHRGESYTFQPISEPTPGVFPHFHLPSTSCVQLNDSIQPGPQHDKT